MVIESSFDIYMQTCNFEEDFYFTVLTWVHFEICILDKYDLQYSTLTLVVYEGPGICKCTNNTWKSSALHSSFLC